MQEFSFQDISDYYDQTEVHYRMFWKLKKSLGLHYGIWDNETRNIQDAIINVNEYLSILGEIKPSERILDAGCGIGGSSFFLAEKFQCRTTGITLSQKQSDTAKSITKSKNLEHLCDFKKCSYTETDFDSNTFDVVWAIESFGSAPKKEMFFKEMNRILKPRGRILIADTLKSHTYDISTNKNMQKMLNGWAISDILSIDEIKEMAENYGFKFKTSIDVSDKIKKSVQKIYYASLIGMIGTKLYNLFKNTSRFSKIHYKTGIAQKKSFDKNDWKYYLMVFEKL